MANFHEIFEKRAQEIRIQQEVEAERKRIENIALRAQWQIEVDARKAEAERLAKEAEELRVAQQKMSEAKNTLKEDTIQLLLIPAVESLRDFMNLSAEDNRKWTSKRVVGEDKFEISGEPYMSYDYHNDRDIKIYPVSDGIVKYDGVLLSREPRDNHVFNKGSFLNLYADRDYKYYFEHLFVGFCTSQPALDSEPEQDVHVSYGKANVISRTKPLISPLGDLVKQINPKHNGSDYMTVNLYTAEQLSYINAISTVSAALNRPDSELYYNAASKVGSVLADIAGKKIPEFYKR